MTDLTPIALWVILIGALVLMAMTINRRRKLLAMKIVGNAANPTDGIRADSPQPFGYKCAWYTVRADDSEAIVHAMQLRDIRPSNWRTGIELAYDDLVFVSPSVAGWIFMVSTRFADFELAEFPREVERTLEMLSLKFGEAQFFATHRTVELHVWAKSVGGELSRGYGYLGETGEILWDDGHSQAENTLQGSIDEDAVMRVAREWSIAPVDLNDAHAEPSLGFVGAL